MRDFSDTAVDIAKETADVIFVFDKDLMVWKKVWLKDGRSMLI